MVESGVLYPSVFVVDTHSSGPPPVPPRLKRAQRGAGRAQSLLFLLVSLALCGMAVEACFIYYLYHSRSAESATASKISGDKPAQRRNPVVLPSKPVAHLTDGQNVTHGKEVMSWNADGNTLLFEMEYKQGGLVIQREGYYYVYSKVFFKESGTFIHAVEVTTPRYLGKSIPLLQSRYTGKRSQVTRSNSFLGGVFHLNKDDAIFVKVNDGAQIVQFRAYENFFGAYMI
ncbi:tumor necrosis factor ligand superfamily member 14 [Polymixia lowei]